MKLVVMIPCYNESQTLTIALDALPKSIPGIDKIETLIIDDGSKDDTAKVAQDWGVDRIATHTSNRGLAQAFTTGIAAALDMGADIIVNTDADNQYCADDMGKLVAPILAGQADMVIGSRPIQNIEHFSPVKKQLQALGSWVVRLVSGTSIPDAPSGFRAFSRESAMQMNVFSRYTYTLETIIQSGQKNLSITSVPVRVNDDLRPSRLVKSIGGYIRKSINTMIRIFVIYRPFRFFVMLGSVIFAAGFLVGLRFLFYYLVGEGSGKVQSLILSALLMGMGFQTILLAFIADLLGVNRMLAEKIQLDVRRLSQMVKNGGQG